VIVAPGQGHDGKMLPDLLDEIRVPRLGPGRPRTTPDKVLGDKAYSSRATRTLLRGRGIVAVIPEPRNQRVNRQRRTHPHQKSRINPRATPYPGETPAHRQPLFRCMSDPGTTRASERVNISNRSTEPRSTGSCFGEF